MYVESKLVSKQLMHLWY